MRTQLAKNLSLARLVIACAFLSCWLLLGTHAHAGPLLVGQIDIDKYEPFSGDGQGGANIIAHYKLNANFDLQDCCQREDIRWLQRVTSSKPTGFTPVPNRPFIDPRSDQPGGFDGLPWYDATFANRNDAEKNMNRNFGIGPFLRDDPRVNLDRGPYSFTAETLLVCIDSDMMLGILGGFQWGFTIGADMATVTTMAIVGLSDNAALRGNFNAALAFDFPGWSIKPANELWPDTQPFVKVPEPSTAILLVSGLAFLLLLRRRPDLA